MSLRARVRSHARTLALTVLVFALLAPIAPSSAFGSGSSSSTSAHASKAHKKKHRRKKKHKRKKCKRYRKVRVKRHGKRVTVKRCVRKHKKKTGSSGPDAQSAPSTGALLPQPGFIVGTVSGPAPAWEATQMPSLHPALVRFEVSIDTSASDLSNEISGLAARGIQALVLAEFQGRVPTTAEAQNLASWAKAYGPGGTFWAGRSDGYLAIRHIEFGNETNYSDQFGGCGPGCSGYTARAQEYAQRARDAIQAINGPQGNPNVNLLVQGDDGGCGCSQWVDGMFSAVPNLNTLVGGWTVHPYGPKGRYGPKLDQMVKDTAKHGDTTVPFYATEYGISTDNGHCLSDNYEWPTCLTYAEAALDLRTSILDMRATYGSRLAAVMVFQQMDRADPGASSNRESYFGIYQHNGAPKGAYTAEVQAEIATYRG
jgi:hypothetical protein